MKILLLGGTAEAQELARHLQAWDAVYSLAGATESPIISGLSTRIGGFGGVDGLAVFLRDGQFTHVIDATHPFASQMKRHVDLAVLTSKIAAIHLIRPAWDIEGIERVADLVAACMALQTGARVFLALGSRHSETFQMRLDVAFLVRSIDPKTDRAPFTYVTGRPPYSVEEEVTTLQKHRIDTVVLRDSGGSQGQSKLVAARQLGLRLILIDRPEPPSGLVVSSVAEVLVWLGEEQAKWLAASSRPRRASRKERRS